MNEILKIAILQYSVEWENIEFNLKKIESLFERFKQPVDIVILPEMFATGFTMHPELFSAEECVSVIDRMKTIAALNHTAIMGSCLWKTENGYFNRLVLTSCDESIQHYDKRHLFSIGEEDEHYIPGKERIVFEIKGWKIFPTICYDLRFPVWCRNNISYDLLINIANWPKVRNFAWDILLKARAVENQSYVLGINRTGTDGRGIVYDGNSKAINMKGELMAECGSSEQILYAEFALNELLEFRNNFPVLKDQDPFQLL